MEPRCRVKGRTKSQFQPGQAQHMGWLSAVTLVGIPVRGHHYVISDTKLVQIGQPGSPESFAQR